MKDFDEIKKEYDKTYQEEFKKTGVFWAFSNAQFEENKTHKDAPDNEYLSVGAGGYIHKSNKEKLDYFLKVKSKELAKDFTSKIDIEDLIKYELANHECYYTGNYLDILDLINGYYEDIPREQLADKIKDVYNNEKS